MKCLINTLIFVIIFFQGCSTKKEPLKPYSINDIKKNKDANRLVEIKLINKSDKESFQVFIDKSDIQERLKKLSLKDYFNMDFNGVDLNIELTHSYKGICDVLSART